MQKILKSVLFIALITVQCLFGQNNLTVNKIMDDPKWIGNLPDNYYWSPCSKYLFYTKEHDDSHILYKYSVEDNTTKQLSIEASLHAPNAGGSYNMDKSRYVYSKDGDLFLIDVNRGKQIQLSNTTDIEQEPVFAQGGNSIVYYSENNLFKIDITGEMPSVIQLTDFREGYGESESSSKHKEWLEKQQENLFDVVKKRKQDEQKYDDYLVAKNKKKPVPVYYGSGYVSSITTSDDLKYFGFTVTTPPNGAKIVEIPEYVTNSGYTKTGNAYAKVGDETFKSTLGIYLTEKDSFYFVSTKQIPGIYDKPEYLFEYDSTQAKKYEEPREVVMHSPVWSPTKDYGIIVAYSLDNKDRWILGINPETGKLELLNRQHDEAWIAGPGIGNKWSSGRVGWLKNGKEFYFQSEATGFSHLYTVNVETKEVTQLTYGEYEVHDVKLSKDNKLWYLTTNQVHPGERHLYSLPVGGGELKRLTHGTGYHKIKLSPDEKYIAERCSFVNKPWELFVGKNGEDYKPTQITNSITDEWKSYNWMVPEVITYKASDSMDVHARLYKPNVNVKNNAAVMFVHGAGYLQNAHKYWSIYYREYMFHNLLTELGYTVIDIDYRGSKGYGRDWRTGIYRHMGGRDLDDYVDGVKYLVEEQGIDEKKIGIYGGSYGGFITLMAMFKYPDKFTSGAALRSVTDWAHYHHWYTSNILNTPVTDSLAYVQSSPIYFVEGLQGNLLMCHGLIDDNVHFQDIVRLSQRLIELEKEDWQLAVYPVERHSFKYATSWKDEYKRILKLFETTIGVKK